MRRTIAIAACLLISTALASACRGAEKRASIAEPTAASYRIVVVTGPASLSEDEYRGATRLVEDYGASGSGGHITHVTYTDDLAATKEAYIETVASLSGDPLVKAMILSQGLPGSAEAVKRVKAARPDVLVYVGEAHEDPLVIQSSGADLVVNDDAAFRGRAVVKAARFLGAKTFVHVSFPRHMAYENQSRRWEAIQESCAELGLKSAFETARDPAAGSGLEGARRFIAEKAPEWVATYGADAAFFITDDSLAEALIGRLLVSGGAFIESDHPSPLVGYPGALGLSAAERAGDYAAVLKNVETAVVSRGGAGRFGTWAVPLGFAVTAGLGDLAKDVIDGKASKDPLEDLIALMKKRSAGAEWRGAYYTDEHTGVRSKNHLLAYTDTYMLGSPGGKVPIAARDH